MTVTRYGTTIVEAGLGVRTEWGPLPDGEWVKYDDYKKLQHAYESEYMRAERLERPGDVVTVRLRTRPECTCPLDVTDHLAACPAFDSHQRS